MIIEPNAAPAADPNANPNADAAAPAAAAPATMSQDALLDALDKGIAQADGKTPPSAQAAESQAAPAETPAAAPGAAPAPAAAAPAAAPAAPLSEAEQKAAMESEIKAMGLKEAAANRFRELTAENTALKRSLHDIGVESPEQIRVLAERAQSASEWENIVNSTNATPQQLGSALEYLRLVNDGAPDSLNRAFEMMQAEVLALGKALGREVGALDPLASHTDLQQAVQAGDITRQHALELAAARAREAVGSTHAQTQQRAAEMQAAERTAIEALNVLGARLQAIDPDYAAKIEILKPTMEIIRANVPPDQWAQAIETAYSRLPRFPQAPAPAVAPAAAPARQVGVGPVPVRPTGAARAPMAKQTFNNPMEALDAGIAMANGDGL